MKKFLKFVGMISFGSIIFFLGDRFSSKLPPDLVFIFGYFVGSFVLTFNNIYLKEVMND